MQRVAFTMQLYKGCEDEYKRRHDVLWPESHTLLKAAGIEGYSIFLNEKTGALFGYLRIPDATALDELPNSPVMQRWWAFMRDIMDTNDDNSPISIPLKEVFYLP